MPPYNAIVEHSPDAVSWHAPDGTYRYVSPAFLALLGYEEADLIGTSPYELFHPEDVRRIQETHEETLGADRPFRVSYRISRSDATYLWVESTGRAVPPTNGSSPGIVVLTRDIEARRSLLSVLEHERQVRERLADVAEQHRSFMTAVSHRTRTPMTAVLGFARLLADRGDDLPEDRRRLLAERLAANAEHLAELIEEVTVLERLSRGDWVARREPIELRPLVEDVLAEHADPEAAPIDVTIPTDFVVVADRQKLRTALSVAARNVVVHTPPGTRMWVHAGRTNGTVEIVVEDDGPGIRDELKESVFEPFTRGDSDAAHDPGMGLGLTMVARVAAEHGGRAWIGNREGGGTAVHLRLPQAAPAEDAGPLPPKVEEVVERRRA